MIERLSAEQIASEVGSAGSTVLKCLRKHEIEIARPASNQRGLSRAYGKQWRNKKAIENRRELEVIRKMKSLREQGFSYWKIASILNSMKVPTKTRRNVWKAATVMKVLTQPD